MTDSIVYSPLVGPTITLRLTDAIKRWMRRMCSMVASLRHEDKAQLEKKFVMLTDEYRDMIMRICYGYATSREEIDDLYQDTLVNIWQGLPRFRGDSSPKTWIYRVTLNTCVSNLRSARRRGDKVSLEQCVHLTTDDGDEQLVKEMYECLARLNPTDKGIVMLWLDEFSYEQIAYVMGLSRSNVAVRLHRAKQRLVKYMETTTN